MDEDSLKIVDSFFSKYIKKIFVFDRVDSTNLVAHRIIAKGNYFDDFAIITKRQTKGKGRGSNVWESPQGGLWVSLVFQSLSQIDFVYSIPFLVSIGVYRLLTTMNLKPLIKWPNDIFVSEKKIAGILIENRIKEGQLEYLIIGIGINLNNSVMNLSPFVAQRATSVFQETGVYHEVMDVLSQLIKEIESLIDILKIHGSKRILEIWKKQETLIGLPVEVFYNNSRYKGIATDINDEGHLIIELTSGGKKVFNQGNLTILSFTKRNIKRKE